MKYFICLFIVCSFSSVKSVKADFCDPSLWQNIVTSQIHTGIYVRGWDVNQDCLDENGRPTTPLYVAVANTQNMYAPALIMEDANVLAVNDAGQTPYAVLWELDKAMYGQLQQASYRWNNLVEEEYEQAQNRIAQGIQNESNPEVVDEMEAALQEISDRWKKLGQTPFNEDDLTVGILNRLFSLFNDLRNLFDQLCPNANIDLCELIEARVSAFNGLKYTPQTFEVTITASILWDMIHDLSAIYQNINDLVLRTNPVDYTEQIMDIRNELVTSEVEVRNRFGNDTRANAETTEDVPDNRWDITIR